LFPFTSSLKSPYSHILYPCYLQKHTIRSRNSAVSIVTGYGLNGQGAGVRVPVGSRIFSSRCSDRFWGPPSLLPNTCRRL
jgi:hypothetical protein